MDIPSSVIGDVISEGEVYHFSSDCPIGIKDHEHVCIKHCDKILLFSTCSSQTDTAIRLAQVRHWNMNTFPMFVPDDFNHFPKTTYVNCNAYYELTDAEFGGLCKSGKITRAYNDSRIDPKQMRFIVNGIRLSTEIPDNIKDLFSNNLLVE